MRIDLPLMDLSTTMMTLVLLSLILADPHSSRVTLERVGRLDHPAIREASGLIKSRRHPGVFWTHNDSGNPPALFAVRRDGSLVREYSINAPNVDWEDVAADDQGHLYIGDIGNNDARLPLRAVYQIDEPDPSVEGRQSLKVKSATYYRFPAGGRFDAEGMVIRGKNALIVAKTFDRRDAEIYAVRIDPPAPLLRPVFAERVGVLADFQEAVTGADLTPDGLRLVVCSLGAVGVYEADGRDGWNPLARKTFKSDDQIEAVAWDGADVILAGEGRGVFRIRSANWRTSSNHPYDK